MHLYHDNEMRKKFMKTTFLEAIFFFSAYLYISFLSPYFKELGFNDFQVSWFFTLFTLTSIFATPVIGAISDSWGRFNMIIFGFGLELISLSIFIISSNTYALIIARIFNAIAYCCIVVTALARVNDTVESSKVRSKINGILQTVISIVTIVSPLVGGYIADRFGYAGVFQASTVFLLVILGGLAIYDKLHYKKKKNTHKKKYNKKDLNLFYNINSCAHIEHFKSIALLGSVVNFSVPITTLVLPYLVLTELGLNNFYLSVVVSTIGIGKLMQFFAGSFADKIGVGYGILIGTLIISISFGLMFLVTNFIWLVILIFSYSVGLAIWNVSASSYISEIGKLHNMQGKIWGGYISICRIFQTFSYIFAGVFLVTINSGILLVYSFLILFGILFTRKHISNHIENGKIVLD